MTIPVPDNAVGQIEASQLMLPFEPAEFVSELNPKLLS